MALEKKGSCEKCSRALALDSEALVCSHECTFCATCSAEMRNVCPNCGGELVPRPQRKVAHEPA